MTRHKNEQGIAIIIVIAIMVALIMITTALLGTVTRVGDAARAYHYDDVVKLGVMSAKAAIINSIDIGKVYDLESSGSPLNFGSLSSGTNISYFNQNMKYVATADEGFYALRYCYSAVNLNKCLFINLVNDCNDVYKPLGQELFTTGINADKLGTASVFGRSNATGIANAIKEVLAVADLYSYNDIGNKAQLFSDEIVFSSLPFSLHCPYETEKSKKMEFRLKNLPKFLIANMVNRYTNNQYNDQSIDNLSKIIDTIYNNRNSASGSELIDKILSSDNGYKADATPDSDDAKKNAALESLAYSLCDEATGKYPFGGDKGNNVASEPHSFTGRLITGDDPVQYYRVFIHAGLVNLNTDDTVAERYYEFVCDYTNKKVISSRWFEIE